MTIYKHARWSILVIADIEEIRDGIEKLLKAEGYRVVPARDEIEAIEKISCHPPDLMLISLGRLRSEVIQLSWQVRQKTGLKEQVPIIIFGLEEVAEGAEVNIGDNIYLTHPDNFNQLRALLHRLLNKYASNPEVR